MVKMDTPLVPFHAGSFIMISEPTGSGKTYWTYKLLICLLSLLHQYYIAIEFVKNIIIR